MPRRWINPHNQWGRWNKSVIKEADKKFYSKNKKIPKEEIVNKWNNSIDHYTKLYNINPINDKGGLKSINELANEIYHYEREHSPENGLYPFLTIKPLQGFKK